MIGATLQGQRAHASMRSTDPFLQIAENVEMKVAPDRNAVLRLA